MNTPLCETSIVRTVADLAAKRVARKVIALLQKTEPQIPTANSGLNNAWDEICVQVQFEYSFDWDAYDQTVRQFVRGYLTKILQHEREALWLQTDEGWRWLSNEEEERDPNPVFDDDIVAHITSEYIYEEAGRWTNKRITDYIDNAASTD
jgi:hypothetical protein